MEYHSISLILMLSLGLTMLRLTFWGLTHSGIFHEASFSCNKTSPIKALNAKAKAPSFMAQETGF